MPIDCNRKRYWPLIVYSVMTSIKAQMVPSESYEAMTSSTGQRVCALDPPSDVIAVRKGSVVRCATQCSQSGCCVVYQFCSHLAECQLYNYVPTNITTNGDCRAFRSKIATGVIEWTYPTTNTGKIYFQCVPSNYKPNCSNACYTSNGNWFERSSSNWNESIFSTEQPIPVRSVICWIAILSRPNATFPSNLKWSQYKSGFGDIATSYYWAGLETIYQLTNSGQGKYRLRFELLASSNKKWYSVEYDWFYLDDEVEGYALHVSQTAVGDAGDGLNAAGDDQVRNVNGKKFFSIDQDTFVLCASRYGGGWWYNSCSGAVLTAQTVAPPGGNSLMVFRWYALVVNGDVTDVNGNLEAARMLIGAF